MRYNKSLCVICYFGQVLYNMKRHANHETTAQLCKTDSMKYQYKTHRFTLTKEQVQHDVKCQCRCFKNVCRTV